MRVIIYSLECIYNGKLLLIGTLIEMYLNNPMHHLNEGPIIMPEDFNIWNLTRCYAQHTLQTYIDSEIYHIRHFIKVICQ